MPCGRDRFRSRLARLIEEGKIHPALKLWEARKLTAQIQGRTVEANSQKGSVREWLRRAGEFFHANLKDWRAEERELATQGLTRLLEQIGTAGGMAGRHVYILRRKCDYPSTTR